MGPAKSTVVPEHGIHCCYWISRPRAYLSKLFDIPESRFLHLQNGCSSGPCFNHRVACIEVPCGTWYLVGAQRCLLSLSSAVGPAVERRRVTALRSVLLLRQSLKGKWKGLCGPCCFLIPHHKVLVPRGSAESALCPAPGRGWICPGRAGTRTQAWTPAQRHCAPPEAVCSGCHPQRDNYQHIFLAET